MHRKPLGIAVLGAEATGKTQTVEFMARQLAAMPVEVVVKPELLRIWCDQHQRTPDASGQGEILASGIQQLTGAATRTDQPTVVLHDTTPLQTAAYHWHYFGSDALDEAALQAHQHVDLTLLMAPDLPYPAEQDWQRGGAIHQMPVHQRLLYLLEKTAQPWALVQGTGEARLQRAWQAVLRHLMPLA